MEQIFYFLENKFMVWAFILTRVAGFLLATPLYSGWYIPTTVKVMFAILTSWLMVFSVPNVNIPLDINPMLMLSGFINNFLVGVIIGFIAYMLISAVMSAGSIFSIQMGFMMASSFDPNAPDIPLLGNYMYLLALYIFAAAKGHVVFYSILANSLKKIPIPMYGVHFDLGKFIIDHSGEMFVLALQIGITIIAFMLVVTVLLGIISRLIPQMNVFMVGIPLKVLLGFIIFLGMIPIWAETFEILTDKMINYAQAFISK